MFAPLYGIPEDPATGSGNVALAGLLASLRREPDVSPPCASARILLPDERASEHGNL